MIVSIINFLMKEIKSGAEISETRNWFAVFMYCESLFYYLNFIHSTMSGEIIHQKPIKTILVSYEDVLTRRRQQTQDSRKERRRVTFADCRETLERPPLPPLAPLASLVSLFVAPRISVWHRTWESLHSSVRHSLQTEEILREIPSKWLNQLQDDGHELWAGRSIGGEMLLRACETGDLPLVQRLIEHHQVDPYYFYHHLPPRSCDSWTAMQLACRYQHLPVVRFLVEQKHVDPHRLPQRRHIQPWTCLESSLAGLLHKLSDADAKDEFVTEVAMYLAHEHQVKISSSSFVLRSLIAKHDEQDRTCRALEAWCGLGVSWQMNFTGSDLHTDALMNAFARNKHRFVDILLSAGAPVHPSFWSSFDIIQYSNHYQSLLKHPQVRRQISQPDYDKSIPEHCAMKKQVQRAANQERLIALLS